MFSETINFIQQTYQSSTNLPLHEPIFMGNEKQYLNECIDSTFVSSVGKFVDQFETMVAEYTGANYAIATMNGTAALHIALKLADVGKNHEVITQPLTFIATCNAIHYCGATPIFIDVDMDTMGLSPKALLNFLEHNTQQIQGQCINKLTGRKIAAVLPMHTFGHPCRIDEIATLCNQYHIPLVEDAAESLGSYYKNKHTGTFGHLGAFSFNGNKIITTGSGGMIITNDQNLAKKAKHITTTAKIPHAYEYIHDEIGYNYRLPNLNAALGCAQMEKLETILKNKKTLALSYEHFFENKAFTFIKETAHAKANHWLNAIALQNKNERNSFLTATNEAGIMTRPIWQLMNRLDMFKHCQSDSLTNAYRLEESIVNIPSGVRL